MRILGDIPDIASVSRFDLDENVSVFTTEHFFNGLLTAVTLPENGSAGASPSPPLAIVYLYSRIANDTLFVSR